jgi:tetratricopeptide (TPR) repeat protein
VYKTLDYLDKHYESNFLLSNVCQDLEAELYNAGLEDSTYFEKRIQFCREFCDYFPQESELIIHNMRRAIAESYAKLNKYEEAEKEFEKLVQEFPNNPWGYIGWGDVYFFEQKKVYLKAQELYEKGLAIAKDKMDIVAIEERLEDLKETM